MADRPPAHKRSDSPEFWAVAAFTFLSVAVAGYVLTPQIAHYVKGPAIFVLFVLEAIVAVVCVIGICVALANSWARAAVGSFQRYLRTLRVPIAIVLGTVAIASLLEDHAWILWVSLAVRSFAAVLAGWLLARASYTIWQCGLGGIFLVFLDHVVVGTATFALTSEWVALLGVLISFAMFAVVPIGLAGVGAYIAWRVPPSNPPVNADARDAPASAGDSAARAGYRAR